MTGCDAKHKGTASAHAAVTEVQLTLYQAPREVAQTRTDSVAKLHIRVDVIQHSVAKTAGLSAALLCLPVLSHCALLPPVHKPCNRLIAP